MKLVPHPDFPRLGQWIPFLQQVEEISDDIGYQVIDATKLQKICALIDPTEEDKSKESEEFQLAKSFPSQLPAPRMFPSGYDGAIDYIKAFGLEENITLETISKPHSSECEINGVVFRNLKIKENVKINFPTLEKIEFKSSEFFNYVSITAKGTPDASLIFTGNKFSESFALAVVNVHLIHIGHNRISCTMDICYDFIPRLSHPFTFGGPTRIPSNNPHNKLLINFLENKISDLTIRDINDALDWNERGRERSLKKIVFAGGNHIGKLIINTKHTTLATHAKLKSDINRISFSASDKFGSLTTKIGSTFHPEEQLTYGRFFSSLEAQASKQHDRINEEKYKRKARYFYRKFLPHRKDRFIFGWTNLISKDGTSWIHPIFWLMGTEALLTGIAYYFLFGCDLTYFLEGGWQILLTLFSWFMNPASLLPLPTLPFDKETFAKAWLIYPLFFFQKLFAVVFYYEAVKTLRRFTR